MKFGILIYTTARGDVRIRNLLGKITIRNEPLKSKIALYKQI